VLTPDVGQFKHIIQSRLQPCDYRILHVPNAAVYRYLSAADFGIVLRDAGVVSWIARPVKAMEYEAVGLSIVHNNTVSWLINRYGYCDIAKM